MTYSKLREELIKKITIQILEWIQGERLRLEKVGEIEYNEYIDGKINLLRTMKHMVDGLVEQGVEKALDSLEKETEVEGAVDWQPSPGEEIEVSNDLKNWHPKPLLYYGMNHVTMDYMTQDPQYLIGGPRKSWKYARCPLVQLPEVREFKASGNTPGNLELTSMSRQLEAITTYLLALQKHPKFQSLINNK